MAVVCGRTELNDIFEKIFRTKSATDIIENKLNLLHQIQIYEMKYFFESMLPSDFEKYVQITYKNQDGFSFIIEKLQCLCDPSLSSETKEKLSAIIDDAYNCFNIVFPMEKYTITREKAVNIAQNKVLLEASKKSKTEEDVAGLKASLGLDGIDSNIKKLDRVFSIANIEKIEQDSQFLLMRIADIKKHIELAEKNFSDETSKLLDELREENSKYKNQLKNNASESINDVLSDLKIRQEEISDVKLNIESLQKRLNDINNGIYNEELARYFLAEHDKLKGKVNPLMFVLQFIFALLLESTINYYWLKEILHMTLIMRIEFFMFCMLVINTFLYLYWYCTSKGDIQELINNWIGLLTPYWCWLGATFSGMAALLFMAMKVCFMYEINGMSYKYLLPYMSIYFALIWFIWFSAKQFSYTKQICDEYEYKYALAKSYLSYRNEAIDVVLTHENNSLVLALLESVINNISHSPVQSVKRDVHSPFGEAFGSVKDILKTKSDS